MERAFSSLLPGYRLDTVTGTERQERAAAGARFAVTAAGGGFEIDLPEFPGHEARQEQAADWSEVERIVSEAWLRHMAVTVGLGFHPDTPLDHYEPALPFDLANGFDGMMDMVFARLEDPYAAGLDAWEKAGLIEELSVARRS